VVRTGMVEPLVPQRPCNCSVKSSPIFLKWQSHEPKRTGPGNCLLKTENGRWKFKINHQKSPTTKSIKSTVDLGPYKRGKWTDWVMHVKWSYKSDGFEAL